AAVCAARAGTPLKVMPASAPMAMPRHSCNSPARARDAARLAAPETKMAMARRRVTRSESIGASLGLPARRGSRCRSRPAALGALLQMQAGRLVEIISLAFQAIDAFVGIDLAERMDRLHCAAAGADVAFGTAFAVTFQPVK